MHRARYARIVGPHEHLGEEFDVPVLLSFPGILLRQRHKVVLAASPVLARGDRAVALDNSSGVRSILLDF